MANSQVKKLFYNICELKHSLRKKKTCTYIWARIYILIYVHILKTCKVIYKIKRFWNIFIFPFPVMQNWILYYNEKFLSIYFFLLLKSWGKARCFHCPVHSKNECWAVRQGCFYNPGAKSCTLHGLRYVMWGGALLAI